MKPLINPVRVSTLCKVYSRLTGEGYENDKARSAIREELDFELGALQKLLRRKINKAAKGLSIMQCRVWANINYAVRPVTILPIASCKVLVRKGVEIELDFIATEENIEAETSKLKAAIAAFNS